MPESLAIETHELRKMFGEQAAVKGLTLQVKQGEVFGFLGPNGAGKTTSIKMLLGLRRPDVRQRLASWALPSATALLCVIWAFFLNTSASRNG